MSATRKMGMMFLGWRRAARAVDLGMKADPLGIALLMFVTILGAVFPVIAAWIGKKLIDIVISISAASRGGSAYQKSALYIWVTAEFVAITAIGLAERSRTVLREILSQRLSTWASLAIVTKAQEMELQDFEQPATIERLTRSKRYAPNKVVVLVQQSIALLGSIVMFGCYVALVVRFNWVAAAILLIALVPSFISDVHFSQLSYRQQETAQPGLKMSSYLEFLLSNIENVKEVRIYRLAVILLSKYKANVGAMQSLVRSLLIRRIIWSFGSSFLSSLAYYGCYAWIASRAVLGAITVGDMVLYLFALRQIGSAAESGLSSLREIYEGSLYMEDLFDLLDAKFSSVAIGQDLQELRHANELGIRLDRVSFRYAKSERMALDNVTLFIPKGSTVALVGENGSGKSTLIKLILGLYRPQSGHIFFDGIDVNTIPRSELFQRFSVLFQDFNRFQMSIRENVGFGDLNRMGNDRAIEFALNAANAAQFSSQFPKGLGTQMGTYFPDGQELSGGQWQRLALARAFMHTLGDIVVLDEPTAALDAFAERQFVESFHQIAKGKTAILISHRFASVRTAGLIIVLHTGKVAEAGSHQELLEAGGKYAAMFSIQARGYQ